MSSAYRIVGFGEVAPNRFLVPRRRSLLQAWICSSGSLKPVVTVALAWHTQAQLQFQYLDFPDSTNPCLYTCNCTVSLKKGLTLHWLVRLKKMKGVLGL